MGLAACSLGTEANQTYEAGGLGVLETPELGRLDDKHVCGHLADAWNARQDVEALAQVRVCVAQCFEASIDRFDLAIDLAQPLSELTLDEGRDGDGLAVEGCTGSQIGGERPSADTMKRPPILKDFIPPADSLMVERLRKAGAIIIGKTNAPEFGLGSHTYNPVYGITRNAYDQTRSAGGSSAAAAVSLALRMLPVADGSDYGGSLLQCGQE